MPAIPFAINTFSTTGNVWGSFRDPLTGVWQTQALLYTNATVPHGEGARFTAGSIIAALGATKGIVVPFPDQPGASDGAGFVFVGNGPPDAPVSVTLPGRFRLFLISAFNQAGGAFFHGGAYYLFVQVDTAAFGAGSTLVVCVKSSDGGATWAEMDSAHAPVLVDPGLLHSGQDVAIGWDGIDDKIQVFAQIASNVGNPCAVFEFDTVAGTWAQATTTFDPGQLSSDNDFVIKFPNGDFGVMYTNSAGIPINAAYRLYSSGSWGAEVVVKASPSAFANAVPSADRETLHTFIYPTQGTISNGAFYRTVTHAGTVSGTLFTIPATTGGSDGLEFGALYGTILLIPYDDQSEVSNAVWECDLSLGNTFTKKLLPRPAGEPMGTLPSCAMVFFADSGTTTAVVLDPIGPVLDLLMSGSSGSGGFNPPTPPNPPDVCIIAPTPTNSSTLVAYNEPLERQGS